MWRGGGSLVVLALVMVVLGVSSFVQPNTVQSPTTRSSSSTCRTSTITRTSTIFTSSRVVLAATSQDAPAAGGGAFFDRKHEREALHKLLMAPPACINVVLGPANSGKTKLLQQYIKEQGKGAAISYINCREVDATSPASFAAALVARGIPNLLEHAQASLYADQLAWFKDNWPAFFAGVAATITTKEPSITVGLTELAKALRDPKQRQQTPSSVADVLAAYTGLLDIREQARAAGALTEGQQYPVLVIDEANKLMRWSQRYADELDTLLSFFVATTKESGRGHVVLATSEYAFQTWLTERIGTNRYEAAVVGDFPENHAREFVEGYCRLDNVTIASLNSTWPEVYQVCGGNAGALRRAASAQMRSSSPGGSWKDALVTVKQSVRPFVVSASEGGDGWTAAQFADAALLLLNGKHNAVPLQDMKMQLGRHNSTAVGIDDDAQAAAGGQAVEALVRANQLSLRPYSTWASDIPHEAYGPDSSDIITAASAVHLSCLRDMRSKLQGSLDRWEQRQPQQAPPAALRLKELDDRIAELSEKERAVKGRGAASKREQLQVEIEELKREKEALMQAAAVPVLARHTVSPEVRDMQAALGKVEVKIEEVEKKIEAVEQEIKDAKAGMAEGWQAEVAALREKEKLLRREKEQLRDEKKQLQEKELLLLKRDAAQQP